MTCIFAQSLTLEPFLPTTLSTATWIATFISPLSPVSVVGLEPVTDYLCNPPATRIPRDRPKKERIRHDEIVTGRIRSDRSNSVRRLAGCNYGSNGGRVLIMAAMVAAQLN